MQRRRGEGVKGALKSTIEERKTVKICVKNVLINIMQNDSESGSVATLLCPFLLPSFPPCPSLIVLPSFSFLSSFRPSFPPSLPFFLLEGCGEGIELGWLDGGEAKFSPKTQ